MPKKLERKLKSQVAKKPWGQKHKDSYVYGTLEKLKKKIWQNKNIKKSKNGKEQTIMKLDDPLEEEQIVDGVPYPEDNVDIMEVY